MVDPKLANVIRLASGSVILRTMATGANMAFALTNFPRDFYTYYYLLTHIIALY